MEHLPLWVQIAIGPFSALILAIVLSWFLSKRYEVKDNQHIEAMKAHINTQTEETKACNERYSLVLNRLWSLEDKVKNV